MFSVYLAQKIPSHHLLVQVVSDELQAVDREPDPEPELCYLGMSVQVGFAYYRSCLDDLELDICYMWMLIQENLMEKARIGITLLLEEEPTEDNIFVTGYTQE